MRIRGDNHKIDYKDTKGFFENRAKKYNTQNPYSVTMYQDKNAKLVEMRNRAEIEKLLPLIQFDENSRILDIACGIGRWADAIGDSMQSYVGVDFSKELIRIARERNTNPKASFLVGSVTELNGILTSEQTFNRVLMIGIMVYLNDDDISAFTSVVERHCEPGTLICMREPVGIETRLTLKDFYSDELEDNYNAIYRTREELISLISPALLEKGFSIVREGYLFEKAGLNNRAETSQYYFILKR